MKVLIVGGVAGGASSAARLRRLDEKAEIVVFERGEYISYANCGLPYYIGGEIKEKAALTLQTPSSFNRRFNVDVRVKNEVTRINREQKTVTVKDHRSGREYEESYDKLILSPGAEPVKPPIAGADDPRVFTLRNIPDTYRIKDYIDANRPKSAVIVGGGYIGIEVAENLKSAGLDVTVVELLDHVIGPIDYDIACQAHNHIRSKGVKLLLKDSVKAISSESDGLRILLGSGETIPAGMVILSVGVRPESSLAKDAGLKLGDRGVILVDEHMQTSDPDIYAVGDAVEVTDFITGRKAFVPLAGPANRQGRIVADNICGIESAYTGTQGSAILKCFDMTIAATGINERTAKEMKLDYEKVFNFPASHASYYPGAVNMTIKTIFDRKTGKVLGAQIAGFDGVDKRIDVLATAIRAGMTVYDLTRLELSYAPPYSSAKDPVNMAGFIAENVLTGKMKVIHWHDIANLPRDGSVTLLDVRTPIEYENGSIEGFINIPVDDLRGRIGELDKSKTVVVTCQVGQRAYYACRILMQNGFDCYNLSGGYGLYRSIFRTEPTANPKSAGQPTNPAVPSQPATPNVPVDRKIKIDACGLQCPGPIMKLSTAVKDAKEGDVIEIDTTDPAFAGDIGAWCRRTGNELLGITSKGGVSTALIRKTQHREETLAPANRPDGKNIIVFSGDLDRAIASFIIANAAASMGRKVRMFFTFWGLNVLRKPERISVKKDLMSGMFGKMMPRGSVRLGLSRMNMAGMGAGMIRGVMKKKNIPSLEELIKSAQESGVELIACTMSMDVMGIKAEELIDGVTFGGAASMLANAEESDMSLFI